MEIDDKALELAKLLLSSPNYTYINNVIVRDNRGQPTGQRVIVIAWETEPSKAERLEKVFREATKAVAGPIGTQCPMCGGSGKVSV